MVALTIPNLALLAAAVVSSLSTMVTARGSYFPDDSLAARGIYLDDELDLAGRGFYDDEPLSVREYIEEQIEIAVRAYAEEFEHLYARHSAEEIATKLKYWRDAVAASQKIFDSLNKAKKRAQAAYRKDKSDANKAALEKADLALWKQNEILQGDLEGLEYWEKEVPSRPGTPDKPSPKASPKGSPKKAVKK